MYRLKDFNPRDLKPWEPSDILVEKYNEKYHTSNIPDAVKMINQLLDKGISCDDIIILIAGMAIDCASFMDMFGSKNFGSAELEAAGIPVARTKGSMFDNKENYMNKENLKNELLKAITDYALHQGYDESDVNDYVVVDINDDGLVQLRSDLFGYYACPGLVKVLDNILWKYDEDAYFEPYDEYVWNAYISLPDVAEPSVADKPVDVEDAKEYTIVIPKYNNGYQTGEDKMDFANIEDVKAFVESYLDEHGKINDLVITKGFTEIKPEDVLDGNTDNEVIEDTDIEDANKDEKFLNALKPLLNVNIDQVKTIGQLSAFCKRFKKIYKGIKIFNNKKLSAYNRRFRNEMVRMLSNIEFIENQIETGRNKESIVKSFKSLATSYKELVNELPSALEEYNLDEPINQEEKPVAVEKPQAVVVQQEGIKHNYNVTFAYYKANKTKAGEEDKTAHTLKEVQDIIINEFKGLENAKKARYPFVVVTTYDNDLDEPKIYTVATAEVKKKEWVTSINAEAIGKLEPKVEPKEEEKPKAEAEGQQTEENANDPKQTTATAKKRGRPVGSTNKAKQLQQVKPEQTTATEQPKQPVQTATEVQQVAPKQVAPKQVTAQQSKPNTNPKQQSKPTQNPKPNPTAKPEQHDAAPYIDLLDMELQLFNDVIDKDSELKEAYELLLADRFGDEQYDVDQRLRKLNPMIAFDIKANDNDGDDIDFVIDIKTLNANSALESFLKGFTDMLYESEFILDKVHNHVQNELESAIEDRLNGDTEIADADPDKKERVLKYGEFRNTLKNADVIPHKYNKTITFRLPNYFKGKEGFDYYSDLYIDVKLNDDNIGYSSDEYREDDEPYYNHIEADFKKDDVTFYNENHEKIDIPDENIMLNVLNDVVIDYLYNNNSFLEDSIKDSEEDATSAPKDYSKRNWDLDLKYADKSLDDGTIEFALKDDNDDVDLFVDVDLDTPNVEIIDEPETYYNPGSLEVVVNLRKSDIHLFDANEERVNIPIDGKMLMAINNAVEEFIYENYEAVEKYFDELYSEY